MVYSRVFFYEFGEEKYHEEIVQEIISLAAYINSIKLTLQFTHFAFYLKLPTCIAQTLFEFFLPYRLSGF